MSSQLLGNKGGGEWGRRRSIVRKGRKENSFSTARIQREGHGRNRNREKGNSEEQRRTHKENDLLVSRLDNSLPTVYLLVLKLQWIYR